MRRYALLPLAFLAAGCSDTGVSRAGSCPATELTAFVGAPVVDLAANESVKPVRVVTEGAEATPERPERLTIRSDGAGRVAGLSCG